MKDSFRTRYQRAGLEFTDGFPEDFHMFNHGVFTIDAARTGGINSLGFVDVRRHGDMIYPNRWVLWLLNRNNTCLNRSMYGPAIKLLVIDRAGTVFHPSPRQGRLFPYGFLSWQTGADGVEGSYHLALERDRTLRMLVERQGTDPVSLVTVISKPHWCSGPFLTRQNQLLHHEYGVKLLDDEVLPKAYRQGLPFLDYPGELRWNDISFDEANHALIFRGVRLYENGEKRPLYVVCGLSEACRMTETPQQWRLESVWNPDGKMAVTLAVGDELEDALERASMSFARSQSQIELLLDETLRREKTSAVIRLEDPPEAADFARVVLDSQSALLVDGGPKYAAILAASGRYGYFPVWDHNYPIRDFITAGDFETARRLLRYALDYPYAETVAFSMCQIVLETAELTAFEGSTDFLREVWTKLLQQFRFIEHYADSKSGLLKTTHCCGVDNPAELGLAACFYAACVNAWYFAALRTMENLAFAVEDTNAAAAFRKRAETLQSHYLKIFYQPNPGALLVAVNADRTIPAIEVFHNSCTIGLDYPYGEYLLHEVLPALAAYKKHRLRHPGGYSAVAFDSKSPCEMWRSVYMNQHLGHDTRTARLVGDAVEVRRAARYYFRMFGHCKTAIETFNLDGSVDDVIQRTAWQTFSATGALHCLHQSLIGLSWSRGGLAYLPADDNQTAEWFGLRFGNCVYYLSIRGTGAFTSTLTVNGQEISGSMLLPCDLPPASERKVEVLRSETPWKLPVLLYITDIPVRNLTRLERGVAFTAAGSGHAPMKFYSPGEVSLRINGNEIPQEYSADRAEVWADRLIQVGDRIECVLLSTIKQSQGKGMAK